MTKVEQAMKLFKGCDQTYRQIICHATGLRQANSFDDVEKHFQTLDEDELQCAIEGMIDDCVEN